MPTVPGYNYLGPQPLTNMDEDYFRYYPPVNALDRIAMEHDKRYIKMIAQGKNPYLSWNEADSRMLYRLENLLSNPNIKGEERYWAEVSLSIIREKERFGVVEMKSDPEDVDPYLDEKRDDYEVGMKRPAPIEAPVPPPKYPKLGVPDYFDWTGLWDDWINKGPAPIAPPPAEDDNMQIVQHHGLKEQTTVKHVIKNRKMTVQMEWVPPPIKVLIKNGKMEVFVKIPNREEILARKKP